MRLETISPDERILVLAPTGRDSALIASVVREAGMDALSLKDVADLCHEITSGAGAIVLAEEAMSDAAIICLNAALGEQPAWSEIPIVLLTTGGMTTLSSARTAKLLEPRANVTLLERPVRILTLTSAIQSAVRARRRQLEVRDLLADKDAALKQRAEDVRRRDEFLAMLGHELRNPLATIRNAVELLAMESDARKNVEHWQVIERQATHLSQLVDDLLDVSRITLGKILLRRTVVDLGDVVRRAVESVRPAFVAHHQELLVEVQDHELTVEGDPVRLEQVVQNLLTNANKYTPARGRIEVRARAEHGQAVLRVKDNGIGISREMLPRVFELFSQADTSLHRASGGLGIGLTVVQRLIDMQGGSVAAHSEGEGRGSEFTVRLPLRPDLRLSPVKHKPAPQHRRKVLLVEDSADARKVMAALLGHWGHEVAQAADGPKAITLAGEYRPEVALVDIGLPGMDGYHVAAALRESLGRDVFLVALTGYGQPEDRDRAMRAGFDLHLVKPVPPDLLARVIAESKDGKH